MKEKEMNEIFIQNNIPRGNTSCCGHMKQNFGILLHLIDLEVLEGDQQHTKEPLEVDRTPYTAIWVHISCINAIISGFYARSICCM